MARARPQDGPSDEPKRRRLLLGDLPGARLPATASLRSAAAAAAAADAAAAAGNDGDSEGDSHGVDGLSDVEAALVLLRNQLYGAGAHPQQPQQPGRHPAPVTSAQQEAAAKRAAKGAALAALPPLVLRPQLYTVLRDRTAADREVERLRAAGRVRVLRLPGGAGGEGEDALMAEIEYRACVRAVASGAKARAAAAAAAAREASAAARKALAAAREASRAEPVAGTGAGGSAAAATGGPPVSAAFSSERRLSEEARRAEAAAGDAAALCWSLRAFEARVAPSADGRLPAPRRAAVMALLAAYDGGDDDDAQEGGGGGAAGAGRGGGAAAAARGAGGGFPPRPSSPSPRPSPDAMITHLMAAGLLARDPSGASAAASCFDDEDDKAGGGRAGGAGQHGQGPGGRATGAPASASSSPLLLLTVPGAGPIARSAPAGRAALLALLRGRPHRELPERELLPAPHSSSPYARLGAGPGRAAAARLVLRGTVLPAAFHVRDALGRGLIRRAEGLPGQGGAVLALVED